MISYELSMGLSVVGVIMVAGTLRLDRIVELQSGLAWNAFLTPIGFITFVVASFAETNRLPFDLPEAEPELVGGYHTEYSGMKFGTLLPGRVREHDHLQRADRDPVPRRLAGSRTSQHARAAAVLAERHPDPGIRA